MSQKLKCRDCSVELLRGVLPREISWGVQMTKEQAKSLFVDSCGGRCLDCYFRHCQREVSALMARIRAKEELKPRFECPQN